MGRRSTSAGLAVGLAALVLVLLSAVHLTQGTSGMGFGDLLGLVAGHARPEVLDVLLGSRLPRLAAGLAVGAALGVCGALLQSVSRNDLAAPDTLGVNAGAHLAVVAVAVADTALPLAPTTVVAFAGGLLAAGLVLAISSAGATNPTRMILAGSVVTLACAAVTQTLQLVDQEATVGLFAWGQGSLVQSGLANVTRLAPVIVGGCVVALGLSRRLDVLTLGDDTAAVLGVGVRRVRTVAVLVAVLLSACAVTVAGPVGFVGLVAPTIVRLLGVRRHRGLIPAAAVAGCVVVLGADVLTRVVLGGSAGVDVPAG
ncbi:MAG TPA: iron chelate uptake ABC transporter family permease subunit, partial [Streptosporangiales bacterium]